MNKKEREQYRNKSDEMKTSACCWVSGFWFFYTWLVSCMCIEVSMCVEQCVVCAIICAEALPRRSEHWCNWAQERERDTTQRPNKSSAFPNQHMVMNWSLIIFFFSCVCQHKSAWKYAYLFGRDTCAAVHLLRINVFVCLRMACIWQEHNAKIGINIDWMRTQNMDGI